MKVPESIVQASADRSGAKHIYRQFLTSMLMEEWMDMCDDIRNEIAPHQFYFRYLVRDEKSSGDRHPEDMLSPKRNNPFGSFTRKRVRVNPSLNIPSEVIDKAGDCAAANDWSADAWFDDIYPDCLKAALEHEHHNGLWNKFTSSQHWVKYVEIKMVWIFEQRKQFMLQKMGLTSHWHAAIVGHQFFPLAVKYSMTAAYLIKNNHPHGRGMKSFAKGYFDRIAEKNTMPMNYEKFFDAVTSY